MRLSYRLICRVVYLCLLWVGARGQRADSLRSRLVSLARERQTLLLKDTDYLRAVDSIAPFLEQEDSLPEWLQTYRDIAFADIRPGRHKAYYYTYLALNAYNTKKMGSAVYYAEKNNEERIRAGLFEKAGLSHADMFAIVLYYNNHDYKRAALKYQGLSTVLRGMPAAASANKLSTEQAFVALSILQVAVLSYHKMGDTVNMKVASELARALLGKMRASDKYLPKYAAYRPHFDYLDHSIDYELCVYRHRWAEAGRLLCTAIENIRDTAFPEGMRADYLGGLYSMAVEFYTDRHKTDSVRHYLQLLRGIGANDRESTSDSVFLIASDGYLLGEEGHYEEAYRQLKKAYQLRDSAFYLVASDRDNNLYALAEADNAHAEIIRSEEKKRRAEQFNFYLFFLLSLLIIAGAVIFGISRWRQRQRLLNVKLGLARNFHDAVGPMLLYANALVKKEMDDHGSDRLLELKAHIGRIMDEVRGIAYDLKSNQLGTVSGLAKESAALLEKLKAATGIDFSVKTENGDRLLSHIQHTHLSRIIQELIGNSVKHAGCNRITVELIAVGPRLQLRYSDDGKGMDPMRNLADGRGSMRNSADGKDSMQHLADENAKASGVATPGIGLQNIRERVNALNGVFELRNAWPNGYSIFIWIPLAGGTTSIHYERNSETISFHPGDR
ncbi:MAG TPA: ATP-binding protein [Puia sp.]|nr:ATP-binding protein [Puia sp.]